MNVSDWIRGVCSAATRKDAPVDAPVPVHRVNITKVRRVVTELDRELARAMQDNPTTKGTSRCLGQGHYEPRANINRPGLL
jgi:hypothetical protein